MFLEIIKATYLKDYKIRLWFNNGSVRDVDLSHSLDGTIYEPLHNMDYFKRFTIHFNTIEWENGADFAPEYLYEHGQTVYDSTGSEPGMVAEPDGGYGR